MQSDSPIELYYWPTPNGFKVSIMLEELGVPYVIKPIDITAGDQYSDEYSCISPNNKIPGIIDYQPSDGREAATIFESGAILMYLGEKYASFIPENVELKSQCLQWLFWQVGGLGPMGGQAHHFRLYASETIEYAINRYTTECHRLYRVLDSQLAGRDYIAGEYSIADISCLPWIFRHERQGQDLEQFPNLSRWYQDLMGRDAVIRGLAVAADLRDDSAFTSKKGREVLFSGKT
jgi:GST-like protein